MHTPLRDEIVRRLGVLRGIAPVLRSKELAPKLYEFYAFSLVVTTLHARKAQIQVRGPDDKPAHTLRFRLGPSCIYTQSARACFVYIRIDNREYELHNGVYVRGRSSQRHELDVCIIERAAARNCCSTPRNDPEWRSVRYFSECKFIGSSRSVPLWMARGFLGLLLDVSHNGMMHFGWFGRMNETLLSNEGNRSAESLLSHYHATASTGVSPRNSGRQSAFLKWLDSVLGRL